VSSIYNSYWYCLDTVLINGLINIDAASRLVLHQTSRTTSIIMIGPTGSRLLL
jgi:glutaredoxin 2